MIEASIAKMSGFIAGAIGSVYAMYLNRANVERMSNLEKAFVFIIGVAIAHYVGGALVEYLSIKQDGIYADGVKFTVGLFGMRIIAEVNKQIVEWIIAFRKKVLGE